MLNQKQKRFAEEYMVDSNATQAAIRAGYSKKTARSIGAENLTKPDIKAYIERLAGELKKKSIADADEALQIATAIARGETTEEVVMLDVKSGEYARTKRVPDEQTRLRAVDLILKRHPLTQQIDLNVQRINIVGVPMPDGEIKDNE